MRSRVKVSTQLLLEEVRKRRAKTLADYDGLRKSYPQELDEYRRNTAAVLRKLADQVEAGRQVFDRYGELKKKLPLFPRTPTAPDTRKIDRLIRTLEMAAEEFIAISADDATEYLG